MSQPPVPQPPETVYGWADAPVSGARVDLHDGPIIAGDPEGARVEVTETRPAVRVIRDSPSTGGANLLFRMGSDGLLQFYRPGSGNVQGDLSGLFYPLG